MTQRDVLISWLKDAHAMESGLIPVLKNHAKDAEDHPEAASRINQHIEETKRHQRLVDECLQRLGADSSGTKDVLGKMTGWIHGISSGGASDENIKNALMDFSAEHMEIASYRAIIEAANQLNEPEVARICQQILPDEERMAEWLKDHLPMMVREFVSKQKVDQGSRR